jgi:alkaline phosphatase
VKKYVLLVILFSIPLIFFGTTKNLVYLIPGGMGFSHLSLLKYTSLKLPAVFTFDDVGFVINNSANSYLIDEAAAGTALATGFKTMNGFIGLDSLGRPVNNIFDASLIQGKAIGLITDSNLLEPLTMSFYAHTKNPGDFQNAFFSFLEKNPDVVFGKMDEKIAQNLRTKLSPDFTIIKSKDELLSIEPWRIKKLLGFYSIDDTATISEILEKSLEILSRNPEGFVLIVVLKGIEKASIKNDSKSLIESLKEFDSVTKKLLDFCKSEGDTLFVVVSPYEIGIPYLDNSFDLANILSTGDATEIKGINWANKSITSNTTFVFAYGPGSDKFRGFHRLSNIALLIADTLKLELPGSFEIIN